MFERKTETAFADWPLAEMLADQGIVHITGKYKDPDLFQRSACGGFFVAVVLTAIAWFVIQPFDLKSWVTFILVFVFGIQLIGWLAVVLLYFFRRKNLDIKIGAEAIDIDGHHYARNGIVQFHLAQHHKAVEWEEKTGRNSQEYGKAVEVIMQYGERGIPIAAIRGRDMEMAHALVLRLQNICSQFDKVVAGMGEKETAPKEAVGGDFGPAPDVR